MRKLSLLIALCTLLTVGGVYATWTYTKEIDVADEAVNMSLNLTDVAYSGSYGTYKVDTSSLKLTIDPKAGTTHVTSLVATGEIVITFTPNAVAPAEVKADGIPSTFAFSLSNPNWQYDDEEGLGARDIVTLGHTTPETIVWGEPNGEGVFTYTISAAELVNNHIHLGEFLLDTKTDYDAFNAVLGQGQIIITVSDGITA